MKNYVQPGQELDVVVPAGGWVSGGVYQVGSIVGVSAGTYAAGEKGVLTVAGVYKMANPDSVTVAQGADVNYDTTAQKIVASGGVVAGKAYAADNGTDAIPVLLPLGPYAFNGM